MADQCTTQEEEFKYSMCDSFQKRREATSHFARQKPCPQEAGFHNEVAKVLERGQLGVDKGPFGHKPPTISAFF